MTRSVPVRGPRAQQLLEDLRSADIPKKPKRPTNAPKAHAMAYLRRNYPLVQPAVKSVRWTPPDEKGDRIPRSFQEDLLRAFDAIAWRPQYPTLFVQWTDAGHRHARMLKVREEFLSKISADPDYRDHKDWLEESWAVEVWGWVMRKGFIVHAWDWQRWSWQEEPELLLAPLRLKG